jgi:hypothetical protein
MSAAEHDPIADLGDLGVTVAWTSDMEDAALYFPKERAMVLNAQSERTDLSEAVADFWPLMAPN